MTYMTLNQSKMVVKLDEVVSAFPTKEGLDYRIGIIFAKTQGIHVNYNADQERRDADYQLIITKLKQLTGGGL